MPVATIGPSGSRAGPTLEAQPGLRALVMGLRGFPGGSLRSSATPCWVGHAARAHGSWARLPHTTDGERREGAKMSTMAPGSWDRAGRPLDPLAVSPRSQAASPSQDTGRLGLTAIPGALPRPSRSGQLRASVGSALACGRHLGEEHQRRLNPLADVIGAAEPKLHENRVDVLFDGVLG